MILPERPYGMVEVIRGEMAVGITSVQTFTNNDLNNKSYTQKASLKTPIVYFGNGCDPMVL